MKAVRSITFFYLWIGFLPLITEGKRVSDSMKIRKSVIQEVELSTGWNKKNWMIGVGAYRTWKLCKKWTGSLGVHAQWIQDGYNEQYITRAPSISTGEDFPSNLTAPLVRENIDTLVLPRVARGALNVQAGLSVQCTKNIIVGASTSLVGFSFGKNTTGLLQFGDGDTFYDQVTDSKPTSTNIFLLGRNSIGTVWNQIYVGYTYRRQWSMTATLTRLRTEQLVLKPVNYFNVAGNYINTARYGYSQWLWGIGLRYRLRK
jgi:hypothetical protein